MTPRYTKTYTTSRWTPSSGFGSITKRTTQWIPLTTKPCTSYGSAQSRIQMNKTTQLAISFMAIMRDYQERQQDDPNFDPRTQLYDLYDDLVFIYEKAKDNFGILLEVTIESSRLFLLFRFLLVYFFRTVIQIFI